MANLNIKQRVKHLCNKDLNTNRINSHKITILIVPTKNNLYPKLEKMYEILISKRENNQYFNTTVLPKNILRIYKYSL